MFRGRWGNEKEDDFEAVRAGSMPVWIKNVTLTEHPPPPTLLTMNHSLFRPAW